MIRSFRMQAIFTELSRFSASAIANLASRIRLSNDAAETGGNQASRQRLQQRSPTPFRTGRARQPL
jgi:hypothetical protein